ncbi:MAG: EAL domain-containing protein [Candidatus Competibacteraceae bacterium]|nr:MAG: EAL domain-containing protein [Candidatus Competibacteraceae bacterium]
MLFIISSAIPIILLTLLSFWQINNLLLNQQYEQLRYTSKQYGIAVLDRLLFLKMKISWIAQSFRQDNLSINSIGNDKFNLKTSQGFKQIRLINNTNQLTFSWGNIEKMATFTQAEKNHLQAGNSIIKIDYQSRFLLRIFLLRMLDPQHPKEGILIGEIDQSYLWGNTDLLEQETQLCVFYQSNRALFCSYQEYELSSDQLVKLNTSSSGKFTWYDHNHEEFLINYWSLFLAPNFLISKWTIITSQSKANILVPIADFRNIFAFVITLTLAIVALLSVYQIRRNLIPLEKLMEGIQYISNKKFNKPIEVSSGDEFEELATSVNNMAVQIDKQFHTLSTMADIDQLILSTLKIEDIIKIVLTRTHEIVPCDYISMTVIDRNHNNLGRTYTLNELFREKITVSVLEITLLEHQALLENQNYIFITHQKNLPGYLLSLQKLGTLSFLILPIVLKNEVSAMICLGYRKVLTLAEEDILLARDFTNRVAVALSNASWEKQLYYMAHYDALTGLPNRLLLKDRLQQALVKAERQKSFVAVLFIDLDRFKHVNDSLGHIAGDILLCQVAQRLSRNLRSEDTISRLGGDEFVIVISHYNNIQESLSVTTTITKKIMVDLSTPFDVNNRDIYSTASIGIACYPTDGQTTNELLKNADSAMYHAKSVGKNNYQFYSKILNAAALERLDMENSLRHALERCEFELYYQPKIETRSRRICGAEALIRWNHPQKGRVSPAQFIPLCEEIGLIISIGEWILHTACMQAKIWQDQGFSSCRIAVNLSPLQFRQPDLIRQVENALNVIGLSSSKIELELTESAAMEDINKTIATLNIFKGMGLHLSIDDFGTGYSSLSYLKRFPIHTLKIDQSFIRNLNIGFEDAAIVKSIITLAHSLKLNVVAEGVETREQFDYLCNHECDEIQGYLFSPPISANEFTKLLGSQTRFYTT